MRQNSNEINIAHQEGHDLKSETVRASQARTQQTNNTRKVSLDAKYSDENSFHSGPDSLRGLLRMLAAYLRDKDRAAAT